MENHNTLNQMAKQSKGKRKPKQTTWKEELRIVGFGALVVVGWVVMFTLCAAILGTPLK